MTTLSERLAELSGKATEGDWEVCEDATGVTFVSGQGGDPVCELGYSDGLFSASDDAALIVELVNAYRAGRLIVKDAP